MLFSEKGKGVVFQVKKKGPFLRRIEGYPAGTPLGGKAGEVEMVRPNGGVDMGRKGGKKTLRPQEGKAIIPFTHPGGGGRLGH